MEIIDVIHCKTKEFKDLILEVAKQAGYIAPWEYYDGTYQIVIYKKELK